MFSDEFEADALSAPRVFEANTPLSLTIDAGYDSSTVAGPQASLSGTFDGPPATGVAALGRAARRVSNRWFVHNIPLAAGVNTIEVTATTLGGAIATRTLTIARDDTLAAAARLTVETPRPIAPDTVRFRLDLAAAPAVTRMRVDFDGNGTQDLDTSNTATPLIFKYPLPGLYTITAILDLAPAAPGAPATTITRDAKVLVQNIAELREDVCAVFGAMRARLRANNVPSALLTLHPRLRPEFQTLWTNLGANLPSVAAQLGTIVDGTLSNDGFAELLIARPLAGQTAQHSGYRVQFLLGPDGVWRIDAM